MEDPITLQSIMYIFEFIIAVVAGVTAIIAIVKWVTSIHDRNKKLDGYEDSISDIKKSIEEMKADTDAKMQALRAEQLIITDSLLAILDGLGQLNCNGPVTEAKDNLVDYINDRAHSKF